MLLRVPPPRTFASIRHSRSRQPSVLCTRPQRRTSRSMSTPARAVTQCAGWGRGRCSRLAGRQTGLLLSLLCLSLFLFASLSLSLPLLFKEKWLQTGRRAPVAVCCTLCLHQVLLISAVPQKSSRR